MTIEWTKGDKMKATPHLFFSFTKLFLGPLRRRFTKENIKKFTLIRFWFADHHWKFNMVPDEHDGGDAGPDDQDDLLESDNDEEPVAGPSHSGGQIMVLNISSKSMFCSKIHSNEKLGKKMVNWEMKYYEKADIFYRR